MTNSITAYPLCWPEGWPRTPHHRLSHAKFGVRGRGLTVAEGSSRVMAELERIGAREIVISTNIQTRRNGLPRSDQREPSDSGVAIYWIDRKTRAPRCMAVDRYHRVSDNLAALAATLDAMRAIERHGGAEILDRAFTGFTALPAPAAERRAPWWEVLGVPEVAQESVVEAAYRRRRAGAHPDRGGTAEEFDQVQRAFAEYERLR